MDAIAGQLGRSFHQSLKGYCSCSFIGSHDDSLDQGWKGAEIGLMLLFSIVVVPIRLNVHGAWALLAFYTAG